MAKVLEWYNSLITHIKTKWDKKRNIKRVEKYNFKDPEGIKKFKEMTSKYTFLSEVFDDENKSINVTTKQFIKRFRYCLSKCFKKTRVGQHNKKNKLLEDLFNKRRILKSKKDDKSVEDLKEVETALSNMCAEENYKTVNEACAGLSCEEGGINVSKLWKLKKKSEGA